ncbi:hypothetical protein DUHN55_22200 [Helicobacter pylori]|jgi:hypothetical protein|uniref:hypothetical protein n=1 Tax=unclassified Janibacter TaxID=2649294 RepID=UPI0020CC14D4|nr:hypothetical protein [Janibacter sp. CX7]UTT66458.1 hypothetical protein NMQ01_01725 [Janibacter sp. CX7]
MKRTIIGCVMAAGLLVGSASAASAGEVTGNGKPTPITEHKARSICAFSGLDTPDEIEGNPPGFDDDFLGHGTQSYGQFVAFGLKDALAAEAPRYTCRGNAGFEE